MSCTLSALSIVDTICHLLLLSILVHPRGEHCSSSLVSSQHAYNMKHSHTCVAYKSTLFFQLHHFGYRSIGTYTFVHRQIDPFLVGFLFPQADVSGTVFSRFVSWFFLSKLLIVCFHFFFNGLVALLLPWVVVFPSPTPRFGGRGHRGSCLF